MATKVMMEALSPTMEEGRLVKWVKNVGDAVKSGDTLAEVETDKAIMELVARGDGILRARLVEEGTTSPIGATIGVIAAADEDISALTSGGGAAAPAAAAPAPTAAAAPAAEAPAAPAAAPATPAPATPAAPVAAAAEAAGPVRSSPLARRLAAERGLSLSAIQGSGPNGRVIRRDIEAAGSTAASTAAAPAAASAAPSASTKPTAAAAPAIQIEGEYKDVALTQMRKTIARRLGESIGPVPTFYLTSEIDMTNVVKLREQMVAAGDAFKVSINDIIIKAVAVALTRHPECNAHWMGDHIRYFAAAHVGMAVATDDGLIVPVIRDAHTKGLGQIGRDARELAKKARERKLTPAEYSGGTFSVSNLGMFGIDQFTAIINPPEAAILAVGSTETKPIWDGNAFVPRQRMRVTMSCDHRIIDGAVGARFLQTFKQLLESPLLMVF
ncbi:MAG TPA: pyruvate dehydrogenase complex dihydrolipoamide acetyltransferase [Gemmatimonas aurantiaca]|uniref:Acetyltransferase component of pyruvate dehydrogenase complex n=2 Tax=Gemmatimonas aurantiaca TaxID=173480 RepID=C1A6D0_GEMAT|nr:pyruvate dehydrogenase complex dihydrolipoamide acetyltransferase [Gemmatimonas aurantiaca]BAH37790.1 pyruvate dehydrogenase E2 component [Gemmatimonas aurantiaca T-27]HCT56568.1 pyruvate dehydrogenase complex dihydrolipoamide acetyltransferase [Gemmatimonas aurantiaca]